MKKIVQATALLFTIIASVGIGIAKSSGPEAIKMKTVPVPFKHWEHQRYNGSECFQCHSDSSDKIAGWGEESAHALCISCHDLNEKGPVECKECHGK